VEGNRGYASPAAPLSVGVAVKDNMISAASWSFFSAPDQAISAGNPDL
jgi:hypothetical protein